MPALESLNHAVGIATVVMQFVAVILLGAYLLRGRSSVAAAIGDSLARWGVWAGFLLTLGAASMSLFYSDVLGILPCSLCWLMRIFMFSQVVLFAMALWKRDRGIADYSIGLSVFGIAIGLYHHALQMLPGSGLPCPATGVSCAQRIIFEFGYITFPLVGVTLFSLLIIVMLFVRRERA